ncbi:hypothetical protein [Ancylobacter sp. IITR112]|uniref:hypothetical protein n=1 Tax=Ancylobacter sp. IITR112 TaxID=3138073 RepID=UPI00352A7E1C
MAHIARERTRAGRLLASCTGAALVPLVAGGLMAAAPAAAQGLPAGKTIEATVRMVWQVKTTTTPTFGFKSTKTHDRPETLRLRVFKVKDQLVFSQPDFAGGTVFVGDTSVTKNALLAGRGRPRCTSVILEGGAKGDYCVSYREEPGSLLLTYGYRGTFDPGMTGAYEYTVRLDLTGKGCSASLAGAQSDTTEEIDYDPSRKAERQVASGRPAGGSCTLIAGRKAF